MDIKLPAPSKITANANLIGGMYPSKAKPRDMGTKRGPASAMTREGKNARYTKGDSILVVLQKSG